LKFVIFGLTVSSSWGNGHATTWRGVLKELHRAGHRIVFFERDTPYYAANRDLPQPPFCELVLYDDWRTVLPRARREAASADVAMVTSYCVDGLAADRLVLDTPGPLHVFYDIDTPITLRDLAHAGVAAAGNSHYLTPELVPEFDLYLSFTGGGVLDDLTTNWGARRAAPLYCSVDPDIHHPVPAVDGFRCALGYLGTYSEDRQPALERLLFEPARRRPQERFMVAGAQYPESVVWPANVRHVQHLPPDWHASFYCSSRVTLNITRQAMLRTGYAPSVRLFEAASCGVPIVTDRWPGLEEFFTPDEDILVVDAPSGVERALDMTDAKLREVAHAARQRVVADHTCQVRARELVDACEQAARPATLASSA